MAAKYTYEAPAGSTITIGDEVYKAGEPFEMDDEQAKAVQREVPEVIPAREERQSETGEQAPGSGQPAKVQINPQRGK